MRRKGNEYEEDRKRVENLHMDDHYTCTDIDAMEDIARQIPMSRIMRPAWDVQVLRDRLGNEVEADEKVWERVWDSTEKANYGSTPMFLISAVKMGGTKLSVLIRKDILHDRNQTAAVSGGLCPASILQ